MYTAIVRPRRIASAQKTLLQRIRKELHKIPNVTLGYRGGHLSLTAFTNNKIWFAHQPLEDAPIPRYWNALGSMPLWRSNSITVEVNPAIHGVDGRVAGLFAVDDETNHTVLLHRGNIGGGQLGVGQAAFMGWYQGPRVEFDGNGQAILVADLESSEFLAQLESFVDIVREFKDSLNADDPTRMSYTDLKRRAAAAPARPKSFTTTGVVRTRNRFVAALAKRRANGRCELCRKPAPFENISNEPYLESHHIVWLSRGGPDCPKNTVALCPNCHRKMHVVNAKKDIEKLKRRAGAKASR